MIKKAIKFLNNVTMTIISGIFLAGSLGLMIANYKLPVNPAWISVIISGLPILYSATENLIIKRKVTSSMLITIAMISSILIGELFAAGEIAFIMAIGEILEDRTVARAKKGLNKLIKLSPIQGRRIVVSDNGIREETVPVEKITVKDVLRVLPGETIPVDGKIISGLTSVDQSIMTGESLPVDKTIGDDVFSGTINCFGSVDIEATKIGEDSSLQKLINMVKEAENKKAPMQRVADKWAAWLVPIALLIAVVTFIITQDIIRAVTVLVVFCPCALALATPTSIMAAIGQATKHGVLIKSGEALENMGKVNTITIDKTGTLTFGKLMVSDIYSFNSELSNDELLSLTASAEMRSEHPLGKAIVLFANNKNIDLIEPEDFSMIPGKGISAVISSQSILCGSSSFLFENGIEIYDDVQKILEKLRKQGKASILIAKNEVCVGIIALSDKIRPNAAIMTKKLLNMGAKTVLLTGDHHTTAKYFADKVGISEVYSELLPENKVDKVINLQKSGRTVCMIGDGVNDAPALKTANVSIAMGSMGSDIAIEASDIALMSDDIAKIPYIKKLSNSTINTIKGNIIASLSINFIAIILSILGLLNPITGAFVHNIGSVLVVLNAALLYERKIKI